MHKIVFLALCLDTASHGRRLSTAQQAQDASHEQAGEAQACRGLISECALNPSQSFAALLLRFSPSAGFRPSGLRGHFSMHNPTMSSLHPVVSKACRHPIPRMRSDELTPSDYWWLNKRGAVQLGNATSDKYLYAQQYLAKTLRTAQDLMPRTYPRVRIKPWFMAWQSLGMFSYMAFSGIAISSVLDGIVFKAPGFTASGLEMLEWATSRFLAGFPADTAFVGILYGLLGGAVLQYVEGWRREKGGDNDELLDLLLLTGFYPVTFIARVLGRFDTSMGERELLVVKDWCPEFVKALLQLFGSLGTCAWVQGVLQQGFAQGFTNLLDSKLEGAVAALLIAVAFEFTAYLIVHRALLPTANAQAQESWEAVATARKRCARLFAYDAPAEVASLRAEAFQQVAKDWQEEQREREQRRLLTNFVRILTAATVYAASGESILAPLLTNLALSNSMSAVLRGQVWGENWDDRPWWPWSS